MRNILLQYGIDENECIVKPLGNGLINLTWLVKSGEQQFVLQKINHKIFKRPEDIAFNIRLIADYLEKNFSSYLFVSPCVTIDGKETVDGYYRMFPFIPNSHTVDVVEKPEQAYEAARQFARFTKLSSGLYASALKITLPDFHNLSLRYAQFEEALISGNPERIGQSEELITVLKQNKGIVNEYEICKAVCMTRVTHHDTKISNVLFDSEGNGLCVIDLDTVMPGYFISDLGDMMRTYVCPVSEEEQDHSKIKVRPEFYQAIVNGYLSEMGEKLTATEKKYIPYAGEFMIYMQALRFLTDHINDDKYYGAAYDGHNFVRAGNQIALLQQFQLFNKKMSG